LTRRRLFTLGTFGAGAGYAFLLEPRWLEVTHKAIRIPHLHRPLRLLHLSDLHYGFRVPLSLLEAAITRGLAEKPDLICLTGDYVTNNWFDHPLALIPVFRRLTRFAPTFAILGNHDVDPLGDILTNAGIRLLENSSAQFEKLSIVGLADLWNDGVNPAVAFEKCPPAQPRIVLAHNPDSKDYLAGYDWSLLLCGHSHGGQVVMPFVGPRAYGIRDQRYLSGLGYWQGRPIHVSRGVGSLWGVRFNCRPEVSLLELHS
jgi:uncharacterized protein